MSTGGGGVLRRIGDFLVSPQVWRLVGLGVVLALLGFAGVMIYKAIPETGFKDVEFTRGLITLLLLVSVIAAVLLMIFAALFSSEDNPQQGVTLEKRITFSRDIITPLVGILGTIVGFYFGSQQSKDVGEAAAKAAAIAAKDVAKDVAKGAPKDTAKGAPKDTAKDAPADPPK